MAEQKYNGWTNYATWRINLEIFDGESVDDWVDGVEPSMLQEMAEDLVLMDVDKQSLIASYAMAFMSEVNWHEIAEHLNEMFLPEIEMEVADD